MTLLDTTHYDKSPHAFEPVMAASGEIGFRCMKCTLKVGRGECAEIPLSRLRHRCLECSAPDVTMDRRFCCRRCAGRNTARARGFRLKETRCATRD